MAMKSVIDDEYAAYHPRLNVTEGESLDDVDETRSLALAADLFHALSDANRLAILRHLTLGEHRVVDLTNHLGLAQSTVSKHLQCLRGCGLVESRPEGRSSMFSLAHERATLDLLAAAERLLALTGDAVALCPVATRSAS